MQLQARPGDDHRAARVVDALAEQVLAEPALLALEHVGQRLQRPVARAGDRAAAAAVVEQRVDGLLQHALLVVDDDLGRAEVEQPLQAVVAVDHAPVEVVQVARREAAAVELDHRAELRRDHRHRLEDHPLGLVLALDERLADLQPLDRALLLLALRGADDVAQRQRLLVEVEIAEQVADRLRAHPAPEVHAEAVRRAEPVLQLAEELLVVDDHLRLGLAEELPGLLEPVDGVDRGLARVLAARLDVEVHLAHLQRPLDQRVEVLLLDLPVGAQAQVVRELANVAVLAHRRPTTSRRSPLPSSRAFSRFFVSTPTTTARRPRRRAPRPPSSASMILLMCFETAPFFEPVASSCSLRRPASGVPDLLGGRADLLELARGELAVVADRGVADELADLLRVLGRDLADELDEHAADEPARLLERREQLLLRPGGETAGPEVVVLVEALVVALGEVRAPAREPLLERGEPLVAVDVDALDLGLDLVLEVVEVLRARLDVDARDDRGGEVEDLLELARSDVEEVADAARDALEEPDVRDGRGQVDVTHPLAAHLLPGHLDAAALADDALVADALVLAAVALPVLGRDRRCARRRGRRARA